MRGRWIAVWGILLAVGCGDYNISESDNDNDGWTQEEGDCDDLDPDVHPSATEACNGIDDDCDQAVDEGFDGDSDGYTVCGADGEPGTEDDDCDDADDAIHPGQDEVECDGEDNDCDEATPDGPDGDGDGANVCMDCDDTDPDLNLDDADGDGVDTCTGDCDDTDETLNGNDDDGDTYTTCDGDCDDDNGDVWPGAEEICDGLDDDCDGAVPDDEVDGDGDGHLACAECDDADAGTYPGAPELCDGLDNDCDGAVPGDEVDGDGDGFLACAECDDADATAYPGAAELCDGVDNDCDGAVPVDETDGDGDGFLACAECDDGDASTFPGAAELCDGEDNDCDGALPTDELDADGDGQMGCAGDCDDGDADVYTGAPDLCDGVADNDCDGVTDPMEADADGDGGSICAGDCDDGDPALNVADLDGDGWTTCDADCDDGEPLANPGLAEICNDWIDNDCDGGAPGCGLYGTISLAQADAKLIGEEANDKLTDLQGMDVAGDVNGDGHTDVIVGAQFHDVAGTDAGAAYLVLGPLQGTVDLSAADAKFLGEADEDHAGSSVAGVGDTNGDGYDDLMIGAGAHDGDGSLVGAAYLVLGPVTGTVGLGSASTKLVGETDGDRAGFPVAAAGDVNGDGFDDVLVAARMNDDGGPDAGAAYLLHGPLPGGELSLSQADARFVGEAAGDEAGLRVNGAGDLDGDGFDDLLIGAWKADTGGSDAGAAYVVYGPVAGDLSLSAADACLEGEGAGDFAGNPVAAAGDVDGDGYGDLLIGARGNDGAASGAGAAYLLYGPVYGTIPLALADARLLGENAADNAGVRVAGPGDVDGDGLDDLLIGAINHDGGGTDSGAAYVLYDTPLGTLSLSDADAVLLGEAADDGASKWLAGPLDANGDGYFDLLISAHGNDAGGTSAGAAYVVLGGGM